VLVGANPSPSPFSRDFDSVKIPRIRAAGRSEENFITYWLDKLEAGGRYVSDGDPDTITVPADAGSSVRARPGQRVRVLGGVS
jgi:hypothetical protein